MNLYKLSQNTNEKALEWLFEKSDFKWIYGSLRGKNSFKENQSIWKLNCDTGLINIIKLRLAVTFFIIFVSFYFLFSLDVNVNNSKFKNETSGSQENLSLALFNSSSVSFEQDALVKKNRSKSVKQNNSSAKSQQTAKKEVLNLKPRFAEPPTPPRYPFSAKRRGIEGLVIVEVGLDPTGRIIWNQIYQSSLSEQLDAAAMKAVLNWKFLPYTKDGRALASNARIPVKFSLD